MLCGDQNGKEIKKNTKKPPEIYVYVRPSHFALPQKLIL